LIVISDTSAITNLAAISQLILLKQLYGTVIIPEAVYKELTKAPISAGGVEAQTCDWIQIRQVSDRTMVDEFLQNLDIGESEAIALAIELNADLVLLDERAAREVAESRKIQLTGVLGVLLAAKKRGLIPALRPLIKVLKTQKDFWLSEALCNRVLRSTEEAPL